MQRKLYDAQLLETSPDIHRFLADDRLLGNPVVRLSVRLSVSH